MFLHSAQLVLGYWLVVLIECVWRIIMATSYQKDKVVYLFVAFNIVVYLVRLIRIKSSVLL